MLALRALGEAAQNKLIAESGRLPTAAELAILILQTQVAYLITQIHPSDFQQAQFFFDCASVLRGDDLVPAGLPS
jgi:hypothetical protein